MPDVVFNNSIDRFVGSKEEIQNL